MPAVLDIIPTTTITTESFTQTSDTIIDVSGYTDAAVFLQVFAISIPSGTTSVALDTAIENRDGQWSALGNLDAWTSAPGLPYTQMRYLHGTSNTNADPITWSGFARYLRVRVNQASGASITFKVSAVLKP